MKSQWSLPTNFYNQKNQITPAVLVHLNFQVSFIFDSQLFFYFFAIL